MLNDHPTYSNAEHHMKLIITSAPGRWIENGARIQVDGLLQYDASDLVWAFHVTGPEVRVDESHTPAVDTLDWDDPDRGPTAADPLCACRVTSSKRAVTSTSPTTASKSASFPEKGTKKQRRPWSTRPRPPPAAWSGPPPKALGASTPARPTTST